MRLSGACIGVLFLFSLSLCTPIPSGPAQAVRRVYSVKSIEFDSVRNDFLYGQAAVDELRVHGGSRRQIAALRTAQFEQLRDVWSDATHGFTVKNVAIDREKIEGDTAKLWIDVAFEDETIVQFEEVTLRKVKGRWRVVIE